MRTIINHDKTSIILTVVNSTTEKGTPKVTKKAPITKKQENPHQGTLTTYIDLIIKNNATNLTSFNFYNGC